MLKAMLTLSVVAALAACGSEETGDDAGADEPAPASTSVAEPEADASAQLACRHFRNVMGDLEILSTPELREKIGEVHENANVSQEPGVAPAAREMLAAATADDGDRFMTAIGDMHNACTDAGL
jgi:hypothetical protein